MRSSASTCITPKPLASVRGTSMQPTVTSAPEFDVLLEHQLVVHLVDVVAGQDDHVLRAVAADDVDVLGHRIGGAEVPLALRDALRGRQDVEALVALRAEEVPAALQVADQAVRLVLGRDADAPDARVDRVRQREVDDPRLAAEEHRGLGALVGELLEAAAAAAGQHVGHGVAGEPVAAMRSELVMTPLSPGSCAPRPITARGSARARPRGRAWRRRGLARRSRLAPAAPARSRSRSRGSCGRTRTSRPWRC